MGVRLHFIVVWIWVPPLTNDTGHLFIGHLNIFLGEMATQILCLFLNWVVCLNYQLVKVISSRYKFVKTSRDLSGFFPLHCSCAQRSPDRNPVLQWWMDDTSLMSRLRDNSPAWPLRIWALKDLCLLACSWIGCRVRVPEVAGLVLAYLDFFPQKWVKQRKESRSGHKPRVLWSLPGWSLSRGLLGKHERNMYMYEEFWKG